MHDDAEPESLDQYTSKDGKEECPATRRNRLCAMEQLKVSRQRKSLPSYVAACGGLEQILDTFQAASSSEQVLEPCIAPLYIFRRVFENEAVRAKKNNNFRVQHEAEQQIEITKVLIRCFTDATWPLDASWVGVRKVINARGIAAQPRQRTVPKSIQQDAEIERVLRELGIDPLALPPHKNSGGCGLKSQVKSKVSDFTAASFDHC